MTETIHVKGNIPLCIRCRKKVYFNEEKRVDGGAWHSVCFTCANPRCNRPLNSRTVTVHQHEVYCQYCYSKLFGPSGFGYGIPQTLTTEKGWKYCDPEAQWIVPAISEAFIAPCKEPSENTRPQDCKMIPSPTIVPAISETFTTPCKDPSENTRSQCKLIHSPNCVISQPRSSQPCHACQRILMKRCHCREHCCAAQCMIPESDYNSGSYSREQGNIQKERTLKVASSNNRIPQDKGRREYNNICGRCGCEVYMAEKLLAAGTVWHKNCFSCRECKKPLDSLTVRERCGDLFCRTCCGKVIGPKGYGYPSLQTHEDFG